MPDLATVMGRFGVAKLSELVGEDTLNVMTAAFRVRVTAPALISILQKRHGTDLLRNKKIRTLVLEHLEAADQGYVLGGRANVSWSAKSSSAARLVEILELPESYLPRSKPPLPPPVNEIGLSSRLHDYQFGIKVRAKHHLTMASSRALIHMPTGAGKTRVASELMVDCMRDQPPGPAIIIWLAHSEELCEQAVEAIQTAWAFRGDHHADMVRLYGDLEKPSTIPERCFVVASFQAAYAMLVSQSRGLTLINSLAQGAVMLVVDEAHKAIAPTYQAAITALSLGAHPPRLVGLSATPGRGGDTAENRELANFFGNTKLGLCDASGNEFPDPIGYLQEMGVLAYLDREKIESRIDMDLTQSELAKLSDFMELPESFLRRLGEAQERNVLIFKKLSDLVVEQRQIILFACSVAHAQLLGDLCTANNISARVITGNTDAYDRAAWIEDYKRGSVQILINYGVLTTGFDAPNTDTVFITRPTTSVVLYSQMLGRAIRGPRNGGNERALVVDVVDNLAGMPAENMAFNFFNHVWT